MRHRVFGRKLNRSIHQRQSLFKNLVISLINQGKLRTTEAKAKAIKGLIDKLVNRAKDSNVAARRLLLSFLHHKDTVNKLVDEIAPTLKDRASGYTRIIRLGNRRGDDAMMVELEFVNEEASLNLANTPEAKAKAKSDLAKAKKNTSPLPAQAKPQISTRITPPVKVKVSNQAHRTQAKG